MSNSERQSPPNFRSRRRHRKSRNGCFECKRRRVKCNEEKPSCGRCTLMLQSCVYPEARPSATNETADKHSLSSPTSSVTSSSSNVLSLPGSLPGSICARSPSAWSPPARSPGIGASTRSTPSGLEAFHDSKDADSAKDSHHVSDTDLYHHYLQHTSRNVTHVAKDQNAFQIGMPTLALQSGTVFHAILALSAACMCCDMISKGSADAIAVHQALATGYHHYNLASEQMRDMISEPHSGLKSEALLASSILLVPFTTASQQINHWLSTTSGPTEGPKLLSTTPRDVIVMTRGIHTMLQALDCGDDVSDLDIPLPPSFEPSEGPPAPSRKHVMFQILAATSQRAFSELQCRLHFACLAQNDPFGDQIDAASISACATAFEVLNRIRIDTFSHSDSKVPACLQHTVKKWFSPEIPLPQMSPWLRSYASRPAIPYASESLTRPFLSFLIQMPQEYIDLVLPLLDRRLSHSSGTSPSHDEEENLTAPQALALDIYAHWSVLMFLLEDESWWIGNLPVVTLSGMVNRYGCDFARQLQPDNDLESDQWWPKRMLNILQEIKQCR